MSEDLPDLLFAVSTLVVMVAGIIAVAVSIFKDIRRSNRARTFDGYDNRPSVDSDAPKTSTTNKRWNRSSDYRVQVQQKGTRTSPLSTSINSYVRYPNPEHKQLLDEVYHESTYKPDPAIRGESEDDEK